jgi:hypothetical protein
MLRFFVLLIALVVPFASRASVIGYSLSVGPGGGGNNTPRLILTNTSDSAGISRFVFTIGDSDYNFDIVAPVGGETTPGVAPTLVTPDGVNDGIRSQFLEVSFTGLVPTRQASFATDVDAGTSNITLDFTTIFFNNGALPNASVLVEFGSAGSLSMVLPDGSAPGSLFTFAQTTDVPEPSTATLFVVACALLARKKLQCAR